MTESQRDPTRAAVIRQNYAEGKRQSKEVSKEVTKGGWGGEGSVAGAEPLHQCATAVQRVV